MKAFVFLYADKDHMDTMIEFHSYSYFCENPELRKPFETRLEKVKTKEEEESIRQEAKAVGFQGFKPIYSSIFNSCIDKRYRQKGFQIHFALFDNTKLSGAVELHPEDNVFYVGVPFIEGKENFVWPDNNYILSQIRAQELEHLRVAGFMRDSCVTKLAKAAYQQGIDTLVDEDLTENLGGLIRMGIDFRHDTFPSHDPRKRGEMFFWSLTHGRKGEPWFWQYD